MIRIYKRPCAALGGAAVTVVQDLVERRRIEIWRQKFAGLSD